MPMVRKEDEPDARARLRAFWARSSLGRPALYVIADDPAYQPLAWPGPDGPCIQNDLDPAWHAHQARKFLDSTLFLAEAMPVVTMRWGSLLTTVAVLAGGEYAYQSDSAWTKPIPGIYERPLPAFDAQHPVVRALERCTRAVAGVVGARGAINPQIMLDGMTTLSLFRTPPQLCLDILERPADVRRWAEALTTLYIATYEHFYALVRSLGYGDTTTWLVAMAEGRCEAVQCDFGVMLSPTQYRQFALPDLLRLTSYLDFSLYHLDGTCQLRFLDELARLPKLNGIQWNPEPGAGPPSEWLGAFRDIRRRGWCLYVACPSVDEALTLTRELGPDGLFLVLPRFKARADAEQAIRDISQACHKASHH